MPSKLVGGVGWKETPPTQPVLLWHSHQASQVVIFKGMRPRQLAVSGRPQQGCPHVCMPVVGLWTVGEEFYPNSSLPGLVPPFPIVSVN